MIKKLKKQKIVPLPISDVTITDKFWAPKLDTFRKNTVNDILHKFEHERGRAVDNFDRVARGETGTHFGYWFYDGQFFEALRGAADFLAGKYDEALDKKLDGYIDRIAAAQVKDPDGYINTWVTLTAPEKRWGQNGRNRAAQHELYNAGCLVEAGVHHYQATSKINLLKLAVRFASYLCDIIGPSPKKPLFTDHPLAEEAFVKLYQLFLLNPDLTEKYFPGVRYEKYLDLARFWIDQRGKIHGEECFSEYQMADMPLRERKEIAGHSVIAALLCTGLASVAMTEVNPAYRAAARRLWESAVYRKLYLTGGAGTGKGGEGFGPDYDLPEDGYMESCAAAAMGFWHHNMNLLFGEARYVDELERVLYNGALVGVSRDGRKYFYSNPLVCDHYNRWSWHECPCCPPMLLKLFGALPSYIYALDEKGIYVNLFIGSNARVKIRNHDLRIRQKTNYPWDGRVKIILQPQKETNFVVRLRIPGWARGKAMDGGLYRFTDKKVVPFKLKINGKKISAVVQKGYVKIERTWCKGDAIELELPMPVKKIFSHPGVLETKEKLALQRGPLIYCFESKDNPEGVDRFFLTEGTNISSRNEKDLLGGTVILKGKVLKKDAGQPGRNTVEVTALPYFAWNNRGPGQMRVWQSTGDIPEFIPSDTIFYDNIEVGIGGRKQGMDLRYTLDGTKPNSRSPLYKKPVRLIETTLLQAQYFEGKSAWRTIISREFKKMDPRQPENPAHVTNGIGVCMYKLRWDEYPKAEGLKPEKSLVGEKISYLDLPYFPWNTNYIVIFSGFIDISENACYTFGIRTPAVAKFFIGDHEVVHKPGSNGSKERKGQIVLGKGKHAFKLICEQRGNEYDRTLDLTYECSFMKKQSVPLETFYMRVNDPST